MKAWLDRVMEPHLPIGTFRGSRKNPKTWTGPSRFETLEMMPIQPRPTPRCFLPAAALVLLLLLGLGSLSTGAERRESARSKSLSFGQVLPKFKVKDLKGRTWKLSHLKGKATLINVWATWCPPCRLELPYVQKLHETIEGRPNLQVLTLNLDEDPTLVPSYMRANGFTFPVVRSFELAEKIHPIGEIPQNWIIDPKGRRSKQSLNGYGEVWLEQIRILMEKTLRRR